MMNPEVKVKWIEALKSGIYPKGVGALNCGGKFCCLGVLCEVMEVPKTVYVESKMEYNFGPLGNYWHGMIPGKFCDIGSKHTEKLAEINDDTETFEEVINYIKENL